jgi:non-heme chloroperoxidase
MVETAATGTLSGEELAEIRRANRTGLRPVVLVHGLWLLSSSWEPWRDRFEDAGYATVAPGRPVAAASVEDVAAHHREAIHRLDRTPALVGHAFGGLVALRLACEGVSAATVVIDPAPFDGEPRMNPRNPNRGPVLLIAGATDDALSLALSRAAYQALRSRNGTPVTELAELRGPASALMGARGRRRVADTALRFLQRYA